MPIIKKKLKFQIRAVVNGDREWVRKFISEHWGSKKVVSRGRIYYPYKLLGFVAIKNKKYIGLITYHLKGKNCEIISLDSLLEKRGVGTTLVRKVEKIARKLNCKKLWMITTNDNTDALRFWQKRGFFIKNIYPNAISLSRKLKPEIPLIGNYGIPTRDEIKLEKILN